MRIYKIANNSPFVQLRKDVNEINAFWHPKVQNGEDIDINNFSIGERKFNSLESALQHLREVYISLRKAKLEDAKNESLYSGWQNNVTACANFLKKQFKKWQQPELF